MSFKQLLREPLVHFLLGGLVLYAMLAWRGDPVDPTSRAIDVSKEQQAQLALQFERTMQRPPTDAELDNLVSQYVREEVLYREAIRLGLDSDDAVVRKRLAQKMDGLAASQAENAQPDEGELKQWLAEHRSRFAPEASFSFDQLWFAKEEAARRALGRLQDGADWQALGEAISLPRSMVATARRDVEARFGRGFAAALDKPAVGDNWLGPISSGFGFHLVRLRARESAETAPLDQIRDEVENDWRSATIAARKDEAYRVLREAYRVNVE